MTDYLLRHAEMLDAEYGQWDDTSEVKRVMSAMVQIENLKFRLRTVTDPDTRAAIECDIAVLEASIEDFGF